MEDPNFFTEKKERNCISVKNLLKMEVDYAMLRKKVPGRESDKALPLPATNIKRKVNVHNVINQKDNH